MNRVLALLAAFVLALGVAIPALAADGDTIPTGRVLIATGGDLTVPAGEVADTVIVVNGHAEILGRVDAVVVAGWRTFRGGSEERPVVRVAAAPMPS